MWCSLRSPEKRFGFGDLPVEHRHRYHLTFAPARHFYFVIPSEVEESLC